MHHNPRMVTLSYNKSYPWGVRLGTLALWALAAASVAYWGLRLSVRPSGMTVPAAAPVPLVPDAQALARLLGAGAAPALASAAAPSLASRFALVGVLAGRASGGGAALIAVDGKPPKPFRVGVAVDAGLVLVALGPRQAQLGPAPGGPVTLTLEMPLKR